MPIYRKWVGRLTVISLCVMIFALPFSKSIVEVCIAVVFTLWVLNRVLSYDSQTSLIHIFKPVSTKLNLPIYLFIIAGLLSIPASASISLSLRGFFSKLLKVVVLYFIVAETINDRKRLGAILTAMVLSMLITSADGIFQFIKGWDFLRHYTQEGRITASFSCANGLGGWLTIMLPLAISIVYTGKHQQPKKAIKFMLFILACILMLCLLLTRSIGAWIGSAFAMVFFIVCRKSKIFLIVTALILVLVIFIIPYLMYANPGFFGLLKEPLLIKKHLVQNMIKMDVVRTHLWREALLIIKDNPIFGCGLNTYSIVAPNYKSGLSEAGIYCHNSYLQMAAETGVVGLASFILVISGLFITSLINLRKIKYGFYRSILIGLLAGLFGFLVHSFFDVHFYMLQLVNLMWFVMGLIVAVQNIALNEKNKSGECGA